MLLVLWAAWIQENARGQILLQHLEAPRIAGPKKNAWELRFHRSEVSTIPPLSAEMDSDNSDLKRHSLRFEDSYRLKPSQVRELLEAGQEVTLERYPTFTLRYMVFSVEHPNMIL